MTDKLITIKDCPKCNSIRVTMKTNTKKSTNLKSLPETKYKIACKDCGFHYTNNSIFKAIKFWNTFND